MRTLVLLLMLALAVSGCLSDDDNADDGTDDGTDPSEDGMGSTGVQDQTETWFLHRSGSCADGDEVFMDKKDSAGDADGCGAVGAFSGSVVESFDSKVKSGGFSSGTAGTATIYLATAHPTQVTANVALRMGETVVAEGTEATATTESVFGAVITYTAFEIPFTTTIEIPDGADLSLDLTVGGATESYFVGYEEDHASQFILG